MSKYFYTEGQIKYGPFSKEELRKKNISRKTKIWHYGMENWTELSKVPELSDVLNSIPPELKSKPTSEDLRDKIEPVHELKEEQRIRTSSSKQEKKASSINKSIFAILALVLVSFFIYLFIHNQSEVNLYNEIAANSYNAGEDFDMYIQKFYRDLEIFGIYPKKPKVTIIKFSKLDQIDNTTHIHGLSIGSNDDSKIEIYINPSTWEQFNKPMRYFLMYHELAHDILNLDDLDAKTWNEGKLMYPEISSYENKTMDDFIESFHALFEEQSTK